MHASVSITADRDALGRRVWTTLCRSEVVRVWLPALGLLALLVGVMGFFLLRSQQQARAQLEQRYALRGALASRFIASYVKDVQVREIAYATNLLAGKKVTAAQFALVSRAFGFEAAVLLDARGRTLNVVPTKPELIGNVLLGEATVFSRAAQPREQHLAVEVDRHARRSRSVAGRPTACDSSR